ncbi:ricin-type beta-trefoil lectin domain protein [Streptomyces sp. NPDC054802]
MSKLRHVVPDTGDEDPGYAALSDAELTERIRAGAPSAHPATQELKRRHMPSLRAYAMLCGRSTLAGNQLAVQAFDLAAQQACRGIGPRGSWGHHLLMTLQRIGLRWAVGSRRARLEPGFAAWLDDNTDPTAPHPPDAPGPRLVQTSAMLACFYGLPEQTRGILWYATVDDEPDAKVGTFVGVPAGTVPELRVKGQDALRKAYIQAYLEHSGDRKCQGFRRIIDAASQPADGRRSNDLTLHLGECTSCARLMGELMRMADAPGAVLAEGLLGWGGAAYAAGGPVRARQTPDSPIERWENRAALPVFVGSPAARGREVAVRSVRWRPSLLTVLAAVAVVAFAAGTWAATGSGGSGPDRDRGQAGAEEPSRWEARPPAAPPTFAPSATITASVTPSKKPSPSPSPATSAPKKKPPAPPKPKPTPSPSKSSPPRQVPISVGGWAQVVHAATGLCLDIDGGVMADRTDVLIVPCDGTATQRWRLESVGLLRSGADPDYCLDSRGSTDRGVGIWSCSSVEGRNGMNLLFAVDSAGAIRPRVAPDFALDPHRGSGGSTLGFEWADGDSDQRWIARY